MTLAMKLDAFCIRSDEAGSKLLGSIEIENGRYGFVTNSQWNWSAAELRQIADWIDAKSKEQSCIGDK